MLRTLVPTLSTFTYLRFQFEQEDYLTVEERLRRYFQATMGEQITNQPKRVSHIEHGSRMHEMITSDFALVEHRLAQEVVICEYKQPSKSVRQILDAIELSHPLPILPGAGKEQP